MKPFFSLWLLPANNVMLWPLYRDGRTGLSFHWRLWTANIAKSSCHNSLFLEFRSSSSCPGGFLDWCSSADSLALQVFNSPSVQYSLSSFTKPSVFLFFFQMLCSIKLPFIFLGTPMPSLRAINDNNGFYSSLHSNCPPPTMIATSTIIAHLRQRSPTSDWCVSRSVGGTDNRARRCSEAKTQTYVFRTRWVIQKT